MKPNVILLSIDALRADHVSFHGYERETTPFLDTLADEAITCSRAYATSSHTRESVPSLLTGHHPCTFAKNGYRLTETSIAEHLSEKGYATAAFHSNPYVSRAYNFDSGFDVFDDDLLISSNKLFALAQRALDKFLLNKGEYHARASEINRKSLDWLSSTDGPFFLWNHYMDVHGPYNPPNGYNKYASRSLTNIEAQALYQKCVKRPEDMTNEDKQLLVDLYDGEITYLDDYLAEFVESLEASGLLDETLLVITSDHGDAFGEHGYYAHPRYLHDELLHVPLLLSPPGGASQRIDSLVSTLDILPTILECIGDNDGNLYGSHVIESGGNVSVDGHTGYALSSAHGKDDNESIRRFSIRTSEWSYFISRDVDSREIEDRRAKNESSVEDKEVEPSDCPTAIRSVLLEHSMECLGEGGQFVVDEANTDPAVEQRLEELGYK